MKRDAKEAPFKTAEAYCLIQHGNTPSLGSAIELFGPFTMSENERGYHSAWQPRLSYLPRGTLIRTMDRATVERRAMRGRPWLRVPSQSSKEVMIESTFQGTMFRDEPWLFQSSERYRRANECRREERCLGYLPLAAYTV